MAATDILDQKRMWKPATLPNKCELIYERLESKMELQNIDGVILKPCTIEQKMACFLDGGYALVKIANNNNVFGIPCVYSFRYDH